jgi:hypothetical protein
MRGRFCHLQLLLFLASTSTLGFRYREAHVHVLFSRIQGSPNLEDQVPYSYPPGTGWPIYTPPPMLGSLFVASYDSQGYRRGIQTCLHAGVGQSGKLLPAFTSTVIPDFSFLEIHDQDFYSLLDMYLFQNGASSSKKEWSVFLCRRYVCCFSMSIHTLSWCLGHHGLCATLFSG